jgi:hypothetical protein
MKSFEAATSSLESKAEQSGEVMINSLREAFGHWLEHADPKDQEGVVSVLDRIGGALEAVTQGRKMAVGAARYSEAAHRFEISLGSGTSGKRVFINTERHATHPRDLIFPNADVAPFLKTAKSYADAFEEVFGSLSKNEGTAERPYYVVPLHEKEREED